MTKPKSYKFSFEVSRENPLLLGDGIPFTLEEAFNTLQRCFLTDAPHLFNMCEDGIVFKRSDKNNQSYWIRPQDLVCVNKTINFNITIINTTITPLIEYEI